MPTKKPKTLFIHYLPVYGSFSTGVIYGTIGVIALLSFFKVREGGADETSILAIFNEYTLGKIVIWIILLGTLSYIVWRMFEAITDPYGYGKKWKGIGLRIGIALSTIADVLIVHAALRVLLGIGKFHVDGQPVEERRIIAHWLDASYGQGLVLGIGAVVFVTAVVQTIYGATQGYKERTDLKKLSLFWKKGIHALALVGYIARGIILGITGFFLLKAGFMNESHHVVNTDKAFDFIGDHVGHFFFIITAIGTICYGLFMFGLGYAYKSMSE